jgi:hypothetical protein
VYPTPLSPLSPPSLSLLSPDFFLFLLRNTIHREREREDPQAHHNLPPWQSRCTHGWPWRRRWRRLLTSAEATLDADARNNLRLWGCRLCRSASIKGGGVRARWHRIRKSWGSLKGWLVGGPFSLSSSTCSDGNRTTGHYQKINHGHGWPSASLPQIVAHTLTVKTHSNQVLNLSWHIKHNVQTRAGSEQGLTLPWQGYALPWWLPLLWLDLGPVS